MRYQTSLLYQTSHNNNGAGKQTPFAQAMAVANDEIIMAEIIMADANNAEAQRDAAYARVAELEAKYEPPRPVGNTPVRIVSGRAYLVKVCTEEGNFWLSRVAAMISTGDDVAFMYDFEIYSIGKCKREDMIEFEGDAPNGPTDIVSRGSLESFARETLPDHVTEEFEDDEPGAPYPTSQDA